MLVGYWFLLLLKEGDMKKSVIVSDEGEDFEEFLAGVKQRHPGPKRVPAPEFKITTAMRRGAVLQGNADRRRLGDDY